MSHEVTDVHRGDERNAEQGEQHLSSATKSMHLYVCDSPDMAHSNEKERKGLRNIFFVFLLLFVDKGGASSRDGQHKH